MLYVDGKWIESGEAVVQPEDRGYNFGDGIYEVMRIYKGRIYQWDAHMVRLSRSAKEVKLELPWSASELHAIAGELMAKNGITGDKDAIIYLQVTRGASPRQHDIPASSRPVLMMFARLKDRPMKEMQNGITAKTVADIRWLRCDIKTLNLLGAVLVKQEAKDAGANDSILHRDGVVTECSASNLFAVKNGELYTHQADHLVLHGITRQTVIDLAKKNNIAVHEQAFDLEFLRSADELFLTGTTSEVTPIVQVDGKPVADGKVGDMARKLQALFEQNIAAEVTVS